MVAPGQTPGPHTFGVGTITVTLDGVPVQFDRQGDVDVKTRLVDFSAATVDASVFLFDISANRPGTYVCRPAKDQPRATLGHTQYNGSINIWIAEASYARSDCTVTVTDVALDVGQHWRGTLSGVLQGPAGRDIQVTNGSFDFIRTK
jgi:hypothetical protein